MNWNETHEEDHYFNDHGQWYRWKGTVDGQDVVAVIYDEAVEDCEKERIIFFPAEGGEAVKEPLNARDCAVCLEAAERKIRAHHVRTGKVLRWIPVDPSGVRVRRASGF